MALEMRFPRLTSATIGMLWMNACGTSPGWRRKGAFWSSKARTTLWRHHASDAGKLCECWMSAAGEWAREDVPFHLVFLMKKNTKNGRAGVPARPI